MKVVRDLSVTSAPYRRGSSGQNPWDEAWISPTTATRPNLVLDFVAGAFGSGGYPDSFDNIVDFARPTDATFVNSGGVIETALPGIARFTHDPISFAQVGLLLEETRQNILVGSDLPMDQSVTVTSSPYVLTFYGDGDVILGGAHVATVSGLGSYPMRRSYEFSSQNGTLNLTFQGNVTAAQLESGAQGSSFISTGAGPVSRGSDAATVAVGTWFDPSKGTFVFGGHLDGADANDRVIDIDDGSSGSRLTLLWNTVLGQPQFQVWNAGALQTAIAAPSNAVAFGDPFRVAIAYSNDDFAISLNGSSTANDTTGSIPANLSALRIGRAIGGAQGLMTAESVVYYPERLDDSELQAISS